MLILGVNCYLHDASAALMGDGKLIAFAAEERFNRKKHDGGFPRLAIEYCLTTAGVKLSEVDHIAFYWQPWKGLVQRGLYMLAHPAKAFGGGGRETGGQASTGAWWDMVTIRKTLEREFGVSIPESKFHFVEHHLAHAASTFFASPFDKADVITIDASGEWDTCLKISGEGNQLRVLQRISNPHSMGIVYGAFTQYLGYLLSCDEGKVMGLSSYGKDAYPDFFEKIIHLKPDGTFTIDETYFNMVTMRQPMLYGEKIVRKFGPPRCKKDPVTKFHEDLSMSLQQMTNRVGLHIAADLQKRTGNNNLCMAGGVALNSVMNGYIMINGPYEHFYAQPASADDGTSLGAALYIYHCVLGRPREFKMDHAYWGPEYSDRQCEDALKAHNVSYRKVDNVEAVAAKWLADGKIVGWFQGRMEVGPRALGNRTILADPRKAEMKDILNARVKHRESYRPFAPSTPLERASEYFHTKGHPSPFMLLVFDVLPEKRKVVPAITHVDGTGRLQTVTRDQNARYYKLIQEFDRLTGVPVVLNTSYNIMGEPIVCTPEDAVKCHLGTGIDCLALGNFVAEKTN